MDTLIEKKLDALNQDRINRITQKYQLTDRERELTAGLIQGLSLSEAAEYMGISKDTVRFHLKNIFKKTETHSQNALILLALR